MTRCDGYFFTATGVSSYEFFNADGDSIVRVSRASFPGHPLRVYAGSFSWTFAPPDAPGATEHALRDAFTGESDAWIYRWQPNRFSVALSTAGLLALYADAYTIQGKPWRPQERSFVFTRGAEEICRIELAYSTYLGRVKYGEQFPRRYVATVDENLDARLLALMLATPFLGIPEIEF